MGGLARWWQREARGTPRRRVVSEAVLIFLTGVGLLALGLVDVWSSLESSATSPWAHLVPLTAGCLIMLAKQRHPVAALAGGGVVLAVDVVLGGSLAVLVVLIDLLYSAALFTGPVAMRRVSAAVVLAIGAFAVAGLVVEGTVQGALLFGLQAFALLGTPLWWGLSVRRQAELTALAEARAADLERLADLREREILTEERTRMARDLHDAVAGNLSAIALHAEAAVTTARSAAGPDTPPDPSLEVIRAASIQSLQEMRSMIMLLRADAATGLDGAVSPPRLREAQALVAAATAQGQAVRWVGRRLEDLPALPAAVDQAAYRILQEALTNTVRHARGPTVDVALEVDGSALRLRVVSAGGAEERGTGWGLLTMRERAEALGGRVQAGPENSTWVVDAVLPMTAGGDS